MAEKPGAGSQEPEVGARAPTARPRRVSPRRGRAPVAQATGAPSRVRRRDDTDRSARSRSTSTVPTLLFWLLASGFWLLLVLPGCASDDDKADADRAPTSVRERQKDALQDPMGYDAGMDDYDVSGGGLTDFDREGFKNDLDRMFNP